MTNATTAATAAITMLANATTESLTTVGAPEGHPSDDNQATDNTWMILLAAGGVFLVSVATGVIIIYRRSHKTEAGHGDELNVVAMMQNPVFVPNFGKPSSSTHIDITPIHERPDETNTDYEEPVTQNPDYVGQVYHGLVGPHALYQSPMSADVYGRLDGSQQIYGGDQNPWYALFRAPETNTGTDSGYELFRAVNRP